MKAPEHIEMWVVYLKTVHGKSSGMHAICEQSEWDAMEASKPGYHVLIQGGITSEAEAEKLARGTSGDRPPRNKAP